MAAADIVHLGKDHLCDLFSSLAKGRRAAPMLPFGVDLAVPVLNVRALATTPPLSPTRVNPAKLACLLQPDTSLASCCDGPDCQPPPYGSGSAWWGIQNGKTEHAHVSMRARRAVARCPLPIAVGVLMFKHDKPQAKTRTPAKTPTTPTTCAQMCRSPSTGTSSFRAPNSRVAPRSRATGQSSLATMASRSRTPTILTAHGRCRARYRSLLRTQVTWRAPRHWQIWAIR